jgi:hypothetical protein
VPQSPLCRAGNGGISVGNDTPDVDAIAADGLILTSACS